MCKYGDTDGVCRLVFCVVFCVTVVLIRLLLSWACKVGQAKIFGVAPACLLADVRMEGGTPVKAVGCVIIMTLCIAISSTFDRSNRYVEKMKLKNSSTRAAIAKLEAQLKQKEEMGDVLHFIDFHQLQIENKQYVMKIEKRNQELIKLKVSTGKIVQALNTKKKELHGLLEQSRWLTSEIASRKEQLRRIREENKRVADKMKGRKKFIGKLKNEAEEASETPQVIDYVRQKAEMYELENKLKNHQRKVEIAEISIRQAR